MPELPQGHFPDDCVDPNLLKQAIYKCMSDGSFFHDRLRQVFLTAGFGVRKVERDECHPIWQVKLLRGTFELATESGQAGRQIRRMLAENRIPVGKDAVAVVIRENYVTVSFVSVFGWENVLS